MKLPGWIRRPLAWACPQCGKTSLFWRDAAACCGGEPVTVTQLPRDDQD